jgi:hypothetical protein
MGRGVRLALAQASICAIAIFGVPAAEAGVVTITPPDQDVQDVYLGSNASGDYLAAWDQNSSDGPLGVLEGSTASALPSSPIETVGEPGASIPHPAVAPDGTRGVVWAAQGPSSSTGFIYGIEVALREPGSGGWTVQILGPPSPANDPWAQTLAFGPGGQALAVWADAGTGDGHPRLIGSFRPAGGTFGAPYVIYVEPVRIAMPTRLTVAFDGAGHPTVVWVRPTATSIALPAAAAAGKHRKHRHKRREVTTPSATYAMTGEVSGSFRSPQLISAGCDAEDFDEAPSGAAAIGLVCNAGRGFRVKVSERGPGGAFQVPKLIPGEGHNDFKPQVAVASSGDITFGWLHRRSLNRHTGREKVRTMFTSGTIGQPFQRCRPINRFLNSDDGPWAIQGGNGRNYLAWIGRRHVTRLAADHGAGLGRPIKIIPRNSSWPVFAIDQAGHGVAFWGAYSHGNLIKGSTFLAP